MKRSSLFSDIVGDGSAERAHARYVPQWPCVTDMTLSGCVYLIKLSIMYLLGWFEGMNYCRLVLAIRSDVIRMGCLTIIYNPVGSNYSECTT
jgi:hypothetical protein